MPSSLRTTSMLGFEENLMVEEELFEHLLEMEKKAAIMPSAQKLQLKMKLMSGGGSVLETQTAGMLLKRR